MKNKEEIEQPKEKTHAELISEVSDADAADVVLYVGDIAEVPSLDFASLVRKKKARNNLLLCIFTGGGDIGSAFRIGRSIQRGYPAGKISILVLRGCKSAGTLIAVGADEIIMSDTAELGPLDVQLLKRDEVGERISGLTCIQALQTLQEEVFRGWEAHFHRLRRRSKFQISAETAGSIAVRLSVSCFSKLYAQIDPTSLGEQQRAMSIATEYANRLNRGNMRDEAIKRLVEGYPEHEFIIDREEAITLFNNVREPTELEEELMYLLEDYVATEIQKHAGREPSIEWLSEDMAPDEEAEDKIDIASKTKEEPPMSPAIKEGPEDGSNDVAGITRMPIPGETRPDSKKISRDDGEVIGEAEPTPTQAKPENTVRSTNRVSGQERAE